MADQTMAPPRKKSRFFADGRSKIDPGPAKEINDRDIQETHEVTAQSEIGKSSLRREVDVKRNDISQDENRGLVGNGPQTMLPDRSIENLGTHNASTSSHSHNKRHGIYGAQNFGLSIDAPASATSEATSSLAGMISSYAYQANPTQYGFQTLSSNGQSPVNHMPGQFYSGGLQPSRSMSWHPTLVSSNFGIDPFSPLPPVNAIRQSFQEPGRLNQHMTNPYQALSGSVPLAALASNCGNPQPLLSRQRVGSDTHSSIALNPVSASAQTRQASSHLASSTEIDTDRDEHGALLPLHLRHIGARVLPNPTQTHRFYPSAQQTPPNFYTSPNRIEKTIAISLSALKRKTSDLSPAPVAHIYVRSGDPEFNIFANGVLLYPELCLALATHLPLRDLVSLYSISRDFHTIIDSRFTTICLAQALSKAPRSAQAFRFRSYAEYCRKDPAARLPHPDPIKAAQGIPRRIPSFRWVAFVMYREKVVHELITVFAERGCPLPARCGLALIRIWTIFDVPDNARRIAIIHNPRLFSELDLYFLMCFFIKLDLVANDPLAPEQCNGLRKLLLSQRGGLDVILKVLKREMWQKQSDIIIAWVKTTMSLENLTEEQLDELNVKTVLGVPRQEVGRGKYEYWGLKGVYDDTTGQRRRYLLRPDQLVLREAIRRGMRLKTHLARCLLYGYVRPDTLESYKPRKYGRRIEEWGDGEYDINSNLGGLRALDVQNGGDPLLDLGNKSRGSQYTLEKNVGKQERVLREQQAKYLEQLYQISEEERVQEMNGKHA